MAIKCASCGRADLMQAQIRTHQCLACGAITDESAVVVVAQAPVPNLSNAGFPVKELGEPAKVILAKVIEAPVEVVEVFETPKGPPSVMGVSDVSGAPSDIDYTNLTTEQVAEIERIVHPGT